MPRVHPGPDAMVGRWLVLAVVGVVFVGAAATTVTPLVADAPSSDATTPDASRALDASALPGDGAFSGERSLATANATFRGAGANDSFGAALANVGDLNDDGHADVAVGAPRNDTAGIDAGAVYVFFGPIDDGEVTASDADVVLHGEAPASRAGAALASADVDGDRVPELVVGAPRDDAAFRNAGAVYVLDETDLAANASLGTATWTLRGVARGDRAGYAVAGVGNRSDDAPDRVVVGAPGNDAAGEDAGTVYVLETPPAGTTSLAAANASVRGEAAGDNAGWSVASARDFDGDDDADVIVGAPRNNATGVGSGAAYVLTNRSLAGESSLTDAAVTFAGAKQRDGAGWAVAGAGDVNGDGVDDVLVGAPFNDTNGNQAGVAYVVTGSDDVDGTVPLNESALAAYGEASGDRAGWAVSAAGSGDVTCDGYADVLVGAPLNDSTVDDATLNDTGAAYLLEGAADLAEERELADADATFRGVSAGDHAGWSVSDVGAVTENDTDDVVIGAPDADRPGVDAGAAYLLDGGCVPSSERPPKTTEPTTTKTTEEPTTTTKTTEPTTTKTTEEPTTTEPTEEPTTTEPTEEPTTTKTTEPTTTTTKTTERVRARVVFNGCGNAVVYASGVDYPLTVRVQVYNPGNGPNAGYRVYSDTIRHSGDSVAGQGGKLVAISVQHVGAFKNPTFEVTGQSARCPGGQKPGEPIDEFPWRDHQDDEFDDDAYGEEADGDDERDDEEAEADEDDADDENDEDEADEEEDDAGDGEEEDDAEDDEAENDDDDDDDDDAVYPVR